MLQHPLITIGWHKGEPDFRISAELTEFDVSRMNDLRAMAVVALGVAEGMFRRANEARHPAQQASK